MYIKGFNSDLECRGMRFEIGREYKIENGKKPLELCTNTVFHFCDSIQKVHEYYSCDSDNRFCEIEVLGRIVDDGTKCGSDHIKVIREIVGDELNTLLGKVNGNNGLFNAGNRNTGNYNAGNYNAGDYNAGNRNTGDYNAGNYNAGNYNAGNRNTGDYNAGNYNAGYYNAGNRNTGDYNAGNYNAGYYNAGDYNAGDYNAGNYNAGYYNAGDYNAGDYNAGNYNAGYFNAGDFNSCNYSAGFFCTNEPKAIVFNRKIDMTVSEFINSKYYKALLSAPFNLTEWICYTEEEKKNNTVKANIGGYLKKYTYKEACANWWAKMLEENKNTIKSMPNFNAKIFEEITGIKE